MPVLEGAPRWRSLQLKCDAAGPRGLPQRRYEAGLSLGCHGSQKKKPLKTTVECGTGSYACVTHSLCPGKLKNGSYNVAQPASERIPGSEKHIAAWLLIFLPPLPPSGPFQQINAAPINKPGGRFAHVARTPNMDAFLSRTRKDTFARRKRQGRITFMLAQQMLQNPLRWELRAGGKPRGFPSRRDL